MAIAIYDEIYLGKSLLIVTCQKRYDKDPVKLRGSI